MSRLWRDDEGKADEPVEEALAAGPPSPMWKAHEGRPAAPAGPDGGEDMWRGGEGQQTAAPRFERRASAPPGEWNRPRDGWAEPTPPVAQGAGRRPRRGSLLRMGVLAVVILGLLLAADGAYAGFKIKSALEDSADRLERGLELFRERDPAGAELEFRAALDRAEEARSFTRHPGVAIASLLPVIERDAKAALAVVEAGREVAEAGLAATEAAAALGLDEDGVAASIFENGRVALDQVRAAAPSVVETAKALQRADQFLATAPSANLELIRTSVDDAHARVEDALATARKGRSLLTTLPKLLGGRTDRRYLLVLQTPSEARATGGVAGLYGILNASDGSLELGKIEPYSDLFRPRRRPVDAPGWFAASYGPQGALTEWPQSNVSPNFPVVADVMTQMYEDTANQSVDGVLSMDPVALASLMRGTGPLEVRDSPAGPLEVTPENVIELLLHDSYLDFETEEAQNAFLAAIVDSFWGEVQEGDLDPHGLGEGIAKAVDSQHFKASVRFPSEQEALAELGLHGAYPRSGPHTQLIFNNNYGINKVDYFLQRSIDSTIELEASGAAHVTTTIALRNGAPAGPRSLLLGLGGNGTPAGTNRMIMSFLLPQGASITSLEVGGDARSPILHSEGLHPVAWFVTDIAAGESQRATIRYDVEGAASLTGQEDDFVFAFVPQASVNADEISVTVIPPNGYSFEAVEGAEVSSDGRLSVSRTMDETVSISAGLAQD